MEVKINSYWDLHPDSPWYIGDEEVERRLSGVDKYDIFGDPNDY